MLNRTGAVLRLCRQSITANRHLSVTPVAYRAATATDPIQQLFVEKVRLYAQKSKSSGGKLVDATPAVEARYKSEIERVEKTYGAVSGEDFTKFPTFNFTDTELEPVGVNVEIKADAMAAELEDGTEAEETPFFIA